MRFRKSKYQSTIPAFTLIEVLVVIAILIVLAGLGFVGMRRAISSAEMANSVTNIKKYAIANRNYATDHGGRYVPSFSNNSGGALSSQWNRNGEFLEYLIGESAYLKDGTVRLSMPTSVLDPVAVRAKKRFWDYISGSYGYNDENLSGSWGQADVVRQAKTATIRDASRHAQFITATDWLADYSGRFIWEYNPAEGKSVDGKIAYRHTGKAIVVFYDGHTETITIEEMRAIDQKKGGLRSTFWGGDYQ